MNASRIGKLLTIIVPCYNGAKYIERCTRSFEGLCDEVEILFVNDGSTDRTIDMLNRYVEEHANVSIITKNNGGYSSAINVGLDNCNSEYVMFLGVDDEISASGINSICNHLRTNRADIVAYQNVKMTDGSCDTSKKLDELTDFIHEGYYACNIGELVHKCCNDTNILFVRDTSRCYKMSLIGNMRYFGKSGVAADGCFSGLVAYKANSFELIKEVGYYWHLHEDSVSARQMTYERLLDELNVWKLFFKEMLESHLDMITTNYVPNQIINNYLSYLQSIHLLSRLEKKEIAKEYKKQFKYIRKIFISNNRISGKNRIKVVIPYIYIKLSETKSKWGKIK